MAMLISRPRGLMAMLTAYLKDLRTSLRCGGDKLAKLPEGFHTIATTPNSEFAAIALLMKASTYMAFNYTLKSHTRKTASKFWRTLLSGFVALSRIGLWLISSTKKFCGFANWSEMARF
jgi:GMP synthase-like glutamine amidotransferase